MSRNHYHIKAEKKRTTSIMVFFIAGVLILSIVGFRGIYMGQLPLNDEEKIILDSNLFGESQGLLQGNGSITESGLIDSRDLTTIDIPSFNYGEANIEIKPQYVYYEENLIENQYVHTNTQIYLDNVQND